MTRHSAELTRGAHGPVKVSVELLSQHVLKTHYHFEDVHEDQIGACINYRGHKDDVIAAGGLNAQTLARSRYEQFLDTEYGYLVISSKAGRGCRGRIEVSHYVPRLTYFAPMFPGVADLFPDGLPIESDKEWYQYTSIDLPNIAAALQQQYPGVKAGCALRAYADGSDGHSYHFTANTPEILIYYGLATRDGTDRLKATSKDNETAGGGGINLDGGAYVYHHSRTSEPTVRCKRQYPPKKTDRECARIWRRISGACY